MTNESAAVPDRPPQRDRMTRWMSGGIMPGLALTVLIAIGAYLLVVEKVGTELVPLGRAKYPLSISILELTSGFSQSLLETPKPCLERSWVIFQQLP